MLDDVWNYAVSRTWNRQQELLKEAERLHRANGALRGAREATRNRVRTAASGRAAEIGRPGRARRGAGGRNVARRSAPVWRTAAARMGSSLVSVGRRLENYGCVERS